MNKTRYSATEFGGNKPMNFRLSGTLKEGGLIIVSAGSVTLSVYGSERLHNSVQSSSTSLFGKVMQSHTEIYFV